MKDFVDTGRQRRVQALEDTATYYADWIKENDRALWNKLITREEETPQPTSLGSISPTGDDELDAYLQDINARANKAVDNSRTSVNLSNDGADRWLKAGAFEDGWQLSDGMKSYVATHMDEGKQLKAGMLGIGEKVADSVRLLSPWFYGGLMLAEEPSIYPVYSFSMDEREKEKQRAAEFVAKDLYDEEAMAENIYANYVAKKIGIDKERDSLMGEKSKALIYKAGEEAAVYSLGIAGIPTWVMRGINTFASEAEYALRSGASYDEAVKSALIYAGTEVMASVLSKHSRKIKFKDKIVEEHINSFVENNILKEMPTEFLRSAFLLGVDVFSEGIENVLVWGMGKFAEWLTYQNDKTFRELIGSKEARREAIEEFLQGYLFSFSENIENE